MSKSILNQTSSLEKPTKVIEVGKFYLLFEGSLTGHPGLIIWKNDEHNLYLAVKFGTSPNKDNKRIDCSLREGDKENLVYKKLFLGKRKNIGKNKLTEMSISEEKLKEILLDLDCLSPTYSHDITRKDKRFFSWAIKNPLYQGQLSDPKGPADVNTIQRESKNVNKK